MNLTWEQQIEEFLTRGIVLETDDYRKYKKHGGALIPSLIDSKIKKIQMGDLPVSLVSSNKVSATDL